MDLDSVSAKASEQRPTFQAGELAVHPAHGVGVVTGIEQRSIGGRQTAFYVLSIAETGMKVLVSVDSAGSVGLRPVMSERDALGVLDILRAPEVAVDVQPWTRRHRVYTEMVKSGVPSEIAKVLRDMSRLRVDKNLSFAERRLLDHAKSLLVRELALATGVSKPAMEAELETMFAA